MQDQASLQICHTANIARDFLLKIFRISPTFVLLVISFRLGQNRRSLFLSDGAFVTSLFVQFRLPFFLLIYVLSYGFCNYYYFNDSSLSIFTPFSAKNVLREMFYQLRNFCPPRIARRKVLCPRRPRDLTLMPRSSAFGNRVPCNSKDLEEELYRPFHKAVLGFWREHRGTKLFQSLGRIWSA